MNNNINKILQNNESLDLITSKRNLHSINSDIDPNLNILISEAPIISMNESLNLNIRELKNREVFTDLNRISNFGENGTLPEPPRLLNSTEIQFVLSGIPVPHNYLNISQISDFETRPKSIYSSDPHVATSVYSNIIHTYRDMLDEIIITPSALNDLKDTFTEFFNLSRVVPGTTVGNIASDAIGAPITQMTLNSFANITGKSVSYGLSYIQELINATERKQLTMTLHFKDKYLSFDEVLNYRTKFVQLNLGILTNDYEILPHSQLSDNYWYPIYSKIKQTQFSEHGLRLYLNVNMMYEYSLDMFKIIKALKRCGLEYISVVPGPLYTGIIDIYPDNSKLKEQFGIAGKNSKTNKFKSDSNLINNSEAPIILLYNVILSKLDSVKLSGINGITGYFATETTIWSLVKAEHKMSKNIDENKFSLILNNRVMFSTGLDSNRLVQFLEYCNFKIIEKTKDRLIIQMPPESGKLTQYVFPQIGNPYPYKNNNNIQNSQIRELIVYPNPSTYINNLADSDESNTESLNLESLKPAPVSKFNRLYKYVFAETNGSNLREILYLDFLDSDKTFTNDIMETRRVLGIEAARNFLIKDLTDSLGSQGSYVDPRHIVFLADYVTHKGLYLSLTFYGLNDQDISYLDKASFERVMDVFIEASVFGKNEAITSATSNMYVGETGKYGTGNTLLEVDAIAAKRYEAEIDKIEKLSLDNIKFDLQNIDLNNINNNQPQIIDLFAALNEQSDFKSDFKSDLKSDFKSNVQIEAASTDIKRKPEIPKIKYSFGALPNDNSNTVNLELNSQPTQIKPTEYKGLNISSVPICGRPVVSDYFASALHKISVIPELKTSEPIPIPLNPTENIILKDNVDIEIEPLQNKKLQTNIQNTKINVPEILSTVEGSKPVYIPVNNLSVSGNSYIPLKSVNNIQIKPEPVNPEPNTLYTSNVKIKPKLSLPIKKPLGFPTGFPDTSSTVPSSIPSNNIKPVDINSFLQN